MRILKIKGKDEKIILNQIEKQYGDQAVVLSTQKEALGRFKFFKQAKTVVTIAVKDENDEQGALINEVTPKAAVSAEVKQEEAATVKMLTSLNEQIKNMEATLRYMQQSATESEKVNNLSTLGSNQNELLATLEDKLLSTGIKKPLCDGILSAVEDETDIENIVRLLYTKLEELLAQPKVEEDLPQTVFFIGSTGVGKTTTIAKLTAQYVLEKKKKVVLFTSDTYRIAAIEQLKTYADILGVPIEIIYDEKDIPDLLEKWAHMDYIFIDTAGRSHKNKEQVEELWNLLNSVDEKQVFLVMNANTAAKDVMNIIDTYGRDSKDFELIITKLDETDEVGNILNISCYAQRPIKYVTTGQNVPADIKLFDGEQYIVDLLGRIQYE